MSGAALLISVLRRVCREMERPPSPDMYVNWQTGRLIIAESRFNPWRIHHFVFIGKRT